MADRIEKYTQKLTGTVAPHCDGPVEAVGLFQPRGSLGAHGVMAGVSGLGGMIMKSQAKKAAGGLPNNVMVAVTPTSIHVFDAKPRGMGWKVKKEAARWPRDSVQVTRGQGSVTDQVTFHFADGSTIGLEAMRLGSGGFNDAVIDVLTGT